MAPKLEVSLLRKAAVYFLEVFIERKAIRTKVRSVYIIALDDIREKTFIKTSLVQRTTFGSSYTRPVFSRLGRPDDDWECGSPVKTTTLYKRRSTLDTCG